MYRSTSTAHIIHCHNLLKFEFSRQIFKVFSEIKLHKYTSSVIRVIPKKSDIMAVQKLRPYAAELMIKLTVAAVQ